MTKPVFSINGQPIPKGWWGWVLNKAAHRDFRIACLMFFRARNADNVVAFMQEGLKKNGYLYNADPLETEDKKAVDDWIERNLFPVKPGPKKVNQMLVTVLEDLLQKARGE